jgi:hypothetical protein
MDRSKVPDLEHNVSRDDAQVLGNWSVTHRTMTAWGKAFVRATLRQEALYLVSITVRGSIPATSIIPNVAMDCPSVTKPQSTRMDN